MNCLVKQLVRRRTQPCRLCDQLVRGWRAVSPVEKRGPGPMKLVFLGPGQLICATPQVVGRGPCLTHATMVIRCAFRRRSSQTHQCASVREFETFAARLRCGDATPRAARATAARDYLANRKSATKIPVQAAMETQPASQKAPLANMLRSSRTSRSSEVRSGSGCAEGIKAVGSCLSMVDVCINITGLSLRNLFGWSALLHLSPFAFAGSF